MTDVELLRVTLDRLNMTYKEAAGITGVSEISMKRYATGKQAIPEKVWRGMLEKEASLYIRLAEIAERARTPCTRCGRPRQKNELKNG